jgi:membrane protease YdiL (CAAX protease family)
VDDGRRIVHGLALVVAQALTFVIGFALVGHWVGLDAGGAYSGSPRALVVVALTGLLQLGGVIGLGLLRWGRLTLRALGWRFDGYSDVLRGVAGALTLVVCMVTLAVLAGESVREIAREICEFTPPQRIEMLLIGLIAATSEETLFRGYLQPALVTKAGAVLGLVLGAGIFALYHAPFTPHLMSLLGKFVVGLVLGALRLRGRSLIGPAVAHFGLWQVVGYA